MEKPLEKGEFTLKQAELNKKILQYILPLTILLSLPYLIIWSMDIYSEMKRILISNFFISLAVLLLGMLLHELLHGLVWALFSKKGLRSIQFGFSRNNFAPYCHFKEPIRLKYYILGGLMPAIFLGLVPTIISWFTGYAGAILFGLVFTLAAGSDILICWMLRKEDLNILVQDFPDKSGCFVISPKAKAEN